MNITLWIEGYSALNIHKKCVSKTFILEWYNSPKKVYFPMYYKYNAKLVISLKIYVVQSLIKRQFSQTYVFFIA